GRPADLRVLGREVKVGIAVKQAGTSQARECRQRIAQHRIVSQPGVLHYSARVKIMVVLGLRLERQRWLTRLTTSRITRPHRAVTFGLPCASAAVDATAL